MLSMSNILCKPKSTMISDTIINFVVSVFSFDHIVSFYYCQCLSKNLQDK